MGGFAASEIPLLSSFLYLFGETGASRTALDFGVKRAGLGRRPTRTEDSVRRGV